MEKIDMIAGMRVEDLPEPFVPSEKFICSECGKSLWISKTALVGSWMEIKKICINCVKNIVEE